MLHLQDTACLKAYLDVSNTKYCRLLGAYGDPNELRVQCDSGQTDEHSYSGEDRNHRNHLMSGQIIDELKSRGLAHARQCNNLRCLVGTSSHQIPDP